MSEKQLHVVTGAFGFSGRYIAARLLQAGHRVRTLTNTRPETDPHSGEVEVRPLDFEDYEGLVDALRGAATFYNTYWVRFNSDNFSLSEALENSRTLFAAAEEAGVGRLVHFSITNPSEDSSLEYFRDKAILERILVESEISHTVLRPAVMFGPKGILINNIAWMLRRFPIFSVFEDGRYRLQPIHVDDVAQLAVEQGAKTEDRTINAIGPETCTSRELVETIGRAIGKKRPVIPVPKRTGYHFIRQIGKLVDDVILTRDEIEGLMAELLYVEDDPAGTTRLSRWVEDHAETLGRHYESELARRRC